MTALFRQLIAFLLCLLFLQGVACSILGGDSSTVGREGNGEGFNGAIATIQNSAVRCDSKRISESASIYEVNCAVVVKEKNGEVKATSLAAGLELLWLDPRFIPGSGVEPQNVKCDNASLTQKCEVSFATNDDSKISFSAKISDVATQEMKTPEAIVKFPYGVESYGYIPFLPTYEDGKKAAASPSDQGRSLSLRGRGAGGGMNSSARAKALGVQLEPIPLEHLSGEIGDICVRGDAIYFMIGYQIYVYEEGVARLYVGSLFPVDTTAFEHRTRARISAQKIACGPKGIYFATMMDNYSYGIAHTDDSGKVTPLYSTRDRFYVRGLAVGPDGSVYFWEADQNRLGKIDSAGKFTVLYADPNRIPNYYGGTIADIAVGPDGAIYLAQIQPAAVLRFTEGVPLPTTVFKPPSARASAGELVVHMDGTIFFSVWTQTFVFSAAGLTEFPNAQDVLGQGASGTCTGATSNMGSMAVLGESLFVVEKRHCRITEMKRDARIARLKLSAESELPQNRSDWTSASADTTAISPIGGITFWKGNILFGNYGINQVDRENRTIHRKFILTEEGQVLENTGFNLQELDSTRAIGHPDGSLYLWRRRTGGQHIVKISPEGEKQLIYTESRDQNFLDAVAVAPDHTVYLGIRQGFWGSKIEKLVNGVPVRLAGHTAAGHPVPHPLVTATPALDNYLEGIRDLVVTPDGAFFISDSRGMIVRLEQSEGNWTLRRIAGTTSGYGPTEEGGGAATREQMKPWGIALDGAGNLYVADTTNARVLILKPDGTGGYSFDTLLGGESIADCSGRVTSSLKDGDAVNSVVSALCFGEIKHIAVDSSACGVGQAGFLKLAFNNIFSKHNTVLYVRRPCQGDL